MKTISEYLTDRKNNFDFIRFVAASLVIFSHSFPITGKVEPFFSFTKGQSTFGHLAVIIFFIISGFLITQSFERSKNIVSYLKARVLRICPALIFVVLVTTLVVGPIFTTLPIFEYFKNIQTYNYLRTIFMFGMPDRLPGVFENNIYPGAINGSLWTLAIEFFFYIVVGLLGYFKLLKKEIALLGFVSTILLSIICTRLNITVGEDYLELFRYFSAGMLFYLFRDKVKLNTKIAIFSVGILIISSKLGVFLFLIPIFGSYLVFYLALHTKIKLHNFNKFGDFSYGLYIYAFPIQQAVAFMTENNLSAIQNFIISFPITLIFAFVSWHLVEKKVLRFKITTKQQVKISA